MASPFSMSKDKSGGGAGAYNALLQKNMKRYKDRDEAVRKTNIATGHGNSTAQRHMHDKPAAKAAPAKAAPAGTDRRKTSSTKRKSNFSLPVVSPTSVANTPPAVSPTSVANTPPTMSPTSVPNSPPAMGPTTMPNSPPPSPAPSFVPPPNPSMFQGSTLQTPPPDLMPPSFPPGLAVSPPFPPDPMAAGAPQNGLHVGFSRPPVGQQPPSPFADPMMGEGRPQGMYGQPSIDPNAIRRLLGLG